ncbi:MAG: serpin family protein, partial [Deltaproteobacteria bacterium]|nr:serpin family protein [Deltaproteobacteria bacterium]
DGIQVVELPYDGDEIAMDLIVPDAGQFENVSANLTADQMLTLFADLETKQVQLAMPKFKYRTTMMLKTTFQNMGMTDVFSSGAADLSGMDGTRDLSVSAIIHKTFVDVDEAGTEAAAATAVIVEGTSILNFDVELTIDRPFLFVIRDLSTGAILFMGAIEDPSAS